MEEIPSYKIVVVGTSGVGKTALVQRLIDDAFSYESKPTIGVEFKSHTCKCGDETVKINIWDTAGQEKFRSISKAYFRNAVGALLVFSFSDRESFDHLNIWLNDLHSLCPENAIIILVGNKVDLTQDRVISNTEAQLFAERHGLDFFETSAFTSYNVSDTFAQLATKIHEKVKLGDIQSPTLQLKSQLAVSSEKPEEVETKQSCC